MWQPDEMAVGQVVAMLEQAGVPNTEVQAAVKAQLDQLQTVPEFNQTVAHVFIRLTDRSVAMRMAAGLVLKNNIRRHSQTMPPAQAAALKAELLAGVADADALIRKTVGTCIATFAGVMGTYDEWLAHWPDLMPALSMHLEPSATPSATDGALDVLAKICEDVPDRMVADASQPLDTLLPKVFALLTAQNDKWRAYSLEIINRFIMLDPPVMQQNIQSLLQAIFHLTRDPSAPVRKQVIIGINQLVEYRFSDVLPHMNGVIEFMLYSMKDADSSVALEAAAFWQAIAERGASMEEQRAAHDAIAPYLSQLVPTLLTGMVYDEDDASMEFADDDDAHIPDKQEDIAPSVSKRGEVEDDEDEEDEDNGGSEDTWNLRKGSAAALDLMSYVFQDDMLQVLLPLTEQLLQSPDWQLRESAILAIGAVADNCGKLVEPHLGTLMPFLLTTIDDPKPLIRSISCWAVSKYKPWIIEQPVESGVLATVLDKILKRCLDNNKRVQEAAISALAEIEEAALELCTPHLGQILEVLVTAFSRYQAKNLLILFDAVATLAEAVGNALAHPQIVEVLVPAVLAKWERFADDERGLIACTECICALVGVMGDLMLPYIEVLYSRIMRLVQARTLALADRSVDPPEFEYPTVSLDLLSCIIETLGAKVAPLLDATGGVPLILAAASTDPHTEMKRVLFAVLGDLAKHCWELLAPHVGHVLPLLLEHFNPNYIAACNNATWAVGEIVTQMGAAKMENEAFLSQAVARLAPICLPYNPHAGAGRRQYHRTIIDTAAVTLGRIAEVSPASVVAYPQLDELFEGWCCALRNAKDNNDKEHATMGLIAALQANPSAAATKVGYVCDAFCSWGAPKLQTRPEMVARCQMTLQAFKLHLGDEQWALLWQSLPQSIQRNLVQTFGIGG